MVNQNELERWAARAGDGAAAALLMLGLAEDLDSASRGHPLSWQVPPGALAERDAEAEYERFLEASTTYRIAVADDHVDPRWLAERLAPLSSVASLWVPVDRPPGGLRRRPLQWPLRLSYARAGARDLDFEDAVGAAARVPHLYTLRRWEDEPAATDVLVVAGPLADAARWATEAKPVANVVLVLDDPEDRWPVVAAHLALLRAATSARMSGLADAGDAAQALGELVRAVSHAIPLDEALWGAFGRRVLLTIERGAQEGTRLPEIAMDVAHELESLHITRSEPPLRPSIETYINATSDSYLREADGATAMAEAAGGAAKALRSLPLRYLQARVDSHGERTFVAGTVADVTAWIGPPEDDAVVAGRPFDETSLDWSRANAYRLSVVLVPLLPPGEPQRAEIELARAGRSEDARFTLDVPDDATEVAARLVVLHRNRVLQTAVLHGRVGDPVRLDERVVVHPRLDDLDDRRPFDLALVANHAPGNVATLLATTDTKVAVTRRPDSGGQITTIGKMLEELIELEPSPGRLGDDRDALRHVWDLAIAGKDLANLLSTNLRSLRDVRCVTILTASGQWFLPIELVYDRAAPYGDKPALCPHYVASEGSGPCGGATCPPRDDSSVVCPLAFWGLSKTIERFHVDDESANLVEDEAVLLGNAKPTREPLSIKRAAFAASDRVTSDACTVALSALPGAVVATDWNTWGDALKAAPTDLLVLLPHTEYKNPAPSLFIAASAKLPRPNIERRFVTGGNDVHPLVMLFGCQTAGNDGDPSGFAFQFMASDSAVVFTSLTRLVGSHAAEMARRLSTQLRSGAALPVADHLVAFRRAAVWDGLLVALAITGYGDAEWTV